MPKHQEGAYKKKKKAGENPGLGDGHKGDKKSQPQWESMPLIT